MVAGKSIVNVMLDFAGVQIPVGIHSIADRKGTEFKRRAKVGGVLGGEIGRREIDKATGTQVRPAEIVKGVQSGGSFVEIPKDTLDAIEAEASGIEGITVDRFISKPKIHVDRIKASYYLAPVAGGGIGLAMLARALRRKRAAAVVKLVLKKRQHEAVIYESRGAVIVSVLEFAGAWRAEMDDAREVLEGVAVSERALDTACQVIDALWAEDADAVQDEPVDDLIVLREALIERALAGEFKAPPEPVVVEDEPAPVTADDVPDEALMLMLEEARETARARAGHAAAR